MKSKTAKIIASLLVLAVLLIFGIKIYKGFVSNAKALDEHLPSSYGYSSDDSMIISNKYLNNIEILEKYNSKVRNPISLFLYDKKYHLLTYKINSFSSSSLANGVHVEMRNVDRSTGVSYSSIGKDISYIYQYKSGELQPSTDIFMTLAGDSIKPLVKNDSIVSYKLKLENLSIRYGAESPIDAFIENEGNFLNKQTTSMNILFLKRKNNFFLMILTPKDSKQVFPGDLLYNMVMNK